LEQAAQGRGVVTIPGGVQKPCSCGTSGYGLVGMVVLAGWLDLMILEVFSNLWFYDYMINSKPPALRQKFCCLLVIFAHCLLLLPLHLWFFFS